MIQVLHRAFTILEWMSASPQRPRGMAEMARKIGVQSATCSHIVKTMVSEGYLRKLGGKRGYVLGPMAYYLSRKGSYREGLVDLAEPRLREFAEKTGETVLLAVAQAEKRFILCQAEGGSEIKVNRDIFYLDDMYHTATGRLLLAYMNDFELKELQEKIGLPPADYWPEASNQEGFEKVMAGIREQGVVVRQCSGELIQIAYPVREAGKVIATVGCFLSLQRYEEGGGDVATRELENIANAVSRKLDAMGTGAEAGA